MANKNLTLATEKYVDDLINNCSPSIITTSDTAKTLSISDSSESVIKGLTAYGESTQDGTPTPDSPVEIKSIENPVINIDGQTVTVPYIFRGLKNSNAGWFVRDEVVVDVKSQTVKIIKRLLERVIDGTENWNGSTSGAKYLITGDKAKGTGNVMSNRFKRGYDEGRVPGEISSTVTNSAVFVMYTEDITVSDFKSMLAEWYASGNPMVMVYVLETPTETDITTTEAGQALLALNSNYPSTSVISDIDLNITYKADTKNYIDNKIAALTALTLEG